ncbi:MAG: creatininase family protein, partial [Chloroflexi bacterium]|nr:creatininase family protein [Chloroflexota bacterium]
LVMAERAELVRDEKRRALAPVWIDLPAKIRAGAKSFKDAGSEYAYFGDPARATIAEGEKILDALAEMIATSVKEII